MAEVPEVDIIHVIGVDTYTQILIAQVTGPNAELCYHITIIETDYYQYIRYQYFDEDHLNELLGPTSSHSSQVQVQNKKNKT